MPPCKVFEANLPQCSGIELAQTAQNRSFGFALVSGKKRSTRGFLSLEHRHIYLQNKFNTCAQIEIFVTLKDVGGENMTCWLYDPLLFHTKIT